MSHSQQPLSRRSVSVSDAPHAVIFHTLEEGVELISSGTSSPRDLELGGGDEHQTQTTKKAHSGPITGAHPSTALTFERAQMPLADLLRALGANCNEVDPRLSQGLTSSEAARRLAVDGPNALTPPKDRPEVIKYLLQYFDPFMLLLHLTGWLSFIAYKVDDAIIVNLWVAVVLWAAVFLSATFSYVTERRAGDAMKSFKKMLPRSATVLRDGARISVPAETLVVGDIVYVGTGSSVPADIRVLHSAEMKCEKSSLTGESLPVSVTAQWRECTKLEDAANIAFSSSQCMEGECIGVVVATGDRTLLGSIAGLVLHVKGASLTPVQIEIHHFVRRLALFAFVLAAVFFFIGLGREKPPLTAFVTAFVIVLVACIPEGLPLTVLTCLSVTSKRMAAKNVFIKQLSSVETLGSVTAIASDKTGTLTQNKMAVVGLWLDDLTFAAQTIGVTFPVHAPVLAHNAPPAGILRPSKAFDHASAAVVPAANSEASGAPHMMTYTLLELAAALCNRARYTDEVLLTAAQASLLERTALLQSLDTTVTLQRMRAENPSLFAGMDAHVSLHQALKTCADVDTTMRGDGQREVQGDATDKALLQFVAQRQSIELLRYHRRIVFEQPFNSRNKYAITITKPHEVSADARTGAAAVPYEQRCLFMKGAPEVVLARCSTYLHRGAVRELTPEFRARFEAAYGAFGRRGERVLGFAFQELDADKYGSAMDDQYRVESSNYPTSGLTFLGLISLVDPPKPGVAEAVQVCRQAGIQVLMVTGDHALTAESIARQVNIMTRPTRAMLAAAQQCGEAAIPDEAVEAIVVEGTHLDAFTEADWARVLSKPEIVFARTTPAQKLAIVQHLQARRHIVAVTGDGVNDSPALKCADIGIAMGLMGSDVARDAADVVLMDDNFASIVEGVRQGRAIFDNLAKTISYTASHLIPETVPTLLYLAFDFPAALYSLAIVAIDCGTEMAPAISFAYETPEGDVMSRPPRPRDTRMIGTPQVLYLFMSGALNSAWTWMAYCLVFRWHDVPLDRLAWSAADYWQDGADPFAIAGPSGCSMDPSADAYTSDCVTIDDARQVDILNQVDGAFFYTLVMFQVAHILCCKTRSVSLFQHAVFENMVMVYGIIIELVLVFLFLFVPKLNSTLVGTPMPGPFFALPLLGAVSILLLSELRKYYTRNHPHTRAAKYLQW